MKFSTGAVNAESRFRTGRFDFHLHTRLSDGHLSPERLWQVVCERGMTGVSITDHDNVDAYDHLTDALLVNDLGRAETAEEQRAGEPWLLPGVEFSTSTNGEELHVLGYFPRGISRGLREFVEEVLRGREQRMARGIRQLRERGLDISLRDCREAAHGRVLSRSHVAEVLRCKRYVHEARHAYKQFLGEGVFPSSACDTGHAVATVRELGGIAVWAHPREGQVERHIRSLVDAGLHGMEVYTPWRQKRERSRLVSVASEFGLVATAGSDWHGQPGQKRAEGFCADENLVGEFLGRVEACVR